MTRPSFLRLIGSLARPARRRHATPKRPPGCALLVEPLEDRAVPTAIAAPDGLVSWWTGDNTAADLVGPNHGTLSNGANFSPGYVADSFHFDGTDDLFQAPTTGLPTGNTDRTLELWVKADAFPTSGEAYFAGYGNFGSGGQTYHVGTTGSNLFWSQWGTGIGGPSLTAGRWHHVAVTNVGNSATLYLDGVAVGSNTVTINTPESTSFYIGRIPGPLGDSRKLDGLVDEVSVYNRALSAEEVQAIYQAGSDGKSKPDYVLADRPSVVEGGDGSTASAIFTINRVGNLAGQATVNWATADGTATAGTDYVAASGQVVFEDGESQKTVAVTVNGDSSEEPNETFKLVLSPLANYVGVSGEATILNDDATVSVGDVSLIEGDQGTLNASFTVTLSAPLGIKFTVNYATADGTALAGSDYVAATGSVTFQPGQTTKVIGVAVLGDTAVEEPRSETFLVNVTAAGVSPSSDLQAMGTVLDNDTTNSPSINFTNFKSTSGLTLVGSAAKAQNSLLRLTPARKNQAGAGWFTAPQVVQGGFKTTFQFSMSGGADGFAFVIQNFAVNALGGSAWDIGYGGIPSSLAVEFDTWQNSSSDFGSLPGDPSGNHVSVQLGGSAAGYLLGHADPSFTLDDRATHTATVEYVPGTSASAGRLQVFLDGATTPVLSVSLDLATALNLAAGGKAWVGFTAGTGGDRNQTHDILSWRFTPLSAALLAEGGQFTGALSAEPLQPTDLQPLVQEAIARWGATGLTAEQSALLGSLTVHIADLGGLTLGLVSGDTIWIDDDAAGWGWFVDPTPWEDSEFTTPGDQGEQGRMDLLTALMHEMGHLLGMEHDDGGVMQETLAAGTRPPAGWMDVALALALEEELGGQRRR